MRLNCRVLLIGAAFLSAISSTKFSMADLVNAGDVAFIGFNADGGDDFAIVLLADAAATDAIFFTDRLWNGAAFTGTSATTFSWTVGGTGLSAGTVVTFNTVRTAPSVNHGSVSGETMSLSSDETIYAYRGTNADTPTTFLAALSNDQNDYNGTDATLTGTGLTQGMTAVLLPPDGTNLADGGQYTGSRMGATSYDDYVSLIGNTASNWSVDPSNGGQYLPFNTTSFQVTSAATPEPASLSLMFLAAGLGALRALTIARNRRLSKTI